MAAIPGRDEQRYGAARAREIIEIGGPHFCIFPNIIFILNQFRIIQPVSVNETVVYYYPTMLKGAPDEMNHRRLAETYLIHGPAGRVAPDDFEVYERNQEGFRARTNDWLVLRRGLHREKHERAGTIAAMRPTRRTSAEFGGITARGDAFVAGISAVVRVNAVLDAGRPRFQVRQPARVNSRDNR